MVTPARLSTFLVAVAVTAFSGWSRAAPQDPVDPESVVVVANKSVPGSVKIAREYIRLRGIPGDHLIVLRTGERERVTRAEFLQQIHNPLLDELADRNLINVIKGKPDAQGRLTVTVFANPIRYLVLCYGMPTTVTGMPLEAIDDLELREKWFAGKSADVAESFKSGPLAKNIASVDGELSLLLKRGVPLNGYVPNPYFRNPNPETVRDILRVSRLDGPTPESVRRLMENTIAAEKSGLKGRAYVDSDGRQGGYQLGNEWMERVATVFEELGFETDRHPGRSTFPADSRFDAPVLYAGWYAAHVEGPFTLPGFKFPPGAVAAHLHSASAQPLHSLDKGWVGPLVDKGACATFGNVAEPYLKFTHYFDLYFASLADGWNVADAAYFALPVLSWQALSIGDPFYRPLAVSLETQLARTGDPKATALDPYVSLRKIQLLLREGQREEALSVSEQAMLDHPAPALALTRARLLEEANRPDEARSTLVPFSRPVSVKSTEWGLYARIADNLLRLGDARNAWQIYQNLDKATMPETVRLAFHRRGIQSAVNAGDNRTAAEWNRLVKPPPPEPADMSDDKPASDNP